MLTWKLLRDGSPGQPGDMKRCAIPGGTAFKLHRRPLPIPSRYEVTFSGVLLDPNCVPYSGQSRKVTAGTFDGTYTLTAFPSAYWEWRLSPAIPFTLKTYASLDCTGGETIKTDLYIFVQWLVNGQFWVGATFATAKNYWVFSAQYLIFSPRECELIPNSATAWTGEYIGKNGTALCVPIE